MMGRMKRRTFIGMSASALGFATTGRVVPAKSVEPYAVGLQEPITIMSIHDSNMAGNDWTWNFRLIRLPNGSNSLSAIQFDNTGEEEEEPWQLDSDNEISNGRELFHSLHDMANEGCIQLWPDMLEQVAAQLKGIDPKLGEEFRNEIYVYFTEWGLLD